MADSAVKEQMWKLKKREYFSIEFLLWTVFDSHITNPAFATIICPTTQLPLSYSLLLNNGNCSAILNIPICATICFTFSFPSILPLGTRFYIHFSSRFRCCFFSFFPSSVTVSLLYPDGLDLLQGSKSHSVIGKHVLAEL